jgi:uncharacterized protein YjdB
VKKFISEHIIGYKRLLSFSLVAIMVFSFVFVSSRIPTAKAAASYYVEYRCHVQNLGWKSWTANHDCGTTDQSLRLEAIQVRLAGGSVPQGVGITYRAHVQNIGWQDWVSDGATAGTTGRGLRIEAFDVNLVNAPVGTSVDYAAHVQNIGWGYTKTNGETAGTTGQGLRMEALSIDLNFVVIN